MESILEFFRGIRAGGLNLLEWAGLVFMLFTVGYSIKQVRDRFSSGVARRMAAKAPVKETPRPGKRPLKELPKGNETILIVDDDPGVLRVHTRLISKLGYNAQRALGGQDAITYIRNNHADLIVLDLLMPGMDGIETFRNIREINPYQKAIVLSGFAGPAMVNSIKTLGVNTYLVKPAEIGILANAIRDEIDRP